MYNIVNYSQCAIYYISKTFILQLEALLYNNFFHTFFTPLATPASGNHQSILYIHELSFFVHLLFVVLDLTCNQSYSICLFLTSFNLMSLRFICVIACIEMSFLLSPNNILLYVHTPSVHPSILWRLWTMLLWIYIYLSMSPLSVLWGIYLSVEFE